MMNNFLKAVFSLCGLVVVFLLSSAQADDEVSRQFDLTDFETIAIAGVFELDAKAGEEYAIILSGHEKQMERVDISVRNGKLTLSSRRGGRGKKTTIYAEVRAPRLTGIVVSGVAEADITNIEADEFKARLSGVGEVTIEGECGFLDAKVSGVGELDAEDLKCREVDVIVSGVGSASVYAAEIVDARVSGMGDIEVSGAPSKVRKSGGFLADISIK